MFANVFLRLECGRVTIDCSEHCRFPDIHCDATFMDGVCSLHATALQGIQLVLQLLHLLVEGGQLAVRELKVDDLDRLGALAVANIG